MENLRIPKASELLVRYGKSSFQQGRRALKIETKHGSYLGLSNGFVYLFSHFFFNILKCIGKQCKFILNSIRMT
jgi:hypothetical protein